MTSANDRIRELQADIDNLRRNLDPVRNHKFAVTLVTTGPILVTEVVGFMSVSGLVAGEGRHVATLSRGVVPGDRRLADWYRSRMSRHVYIEIEGLDDPIALRWAEPIGLAFSDLDAGANQLLIEQISVEYAELTY